MSSTLCNHEFLQAKARSALNRQLTKSLIASSLLAGFVALAFVLGAAVQESRAAGRTAAQPAGAISIPQPAQSGTLSARTLVF